MTPQKRRASAVAKCLSLVGAVGILVALVEFGLHFTPGGPLRALVPGAAMLAAAVALIAGAIALDRWAWKGPPESARGFEPVVPAEDRRADEIGE
jgi:hypothetical protein